MSLKKTILILLIGAVLSVVIGLSVKPASGKEDRFRIFVIITGGLTVGLLAFPFM
jgi:gas vesicle protein